jgi:hypothetical protein
MQCHQWPLVCRIRIKSATTDAVGAPNANGLGYGSRLVCLNEARAKAVEFFTGNAAVIKAINATVQAEELKDEPDEPRGPRIPSIGRPPR